MSNTVEMLRSLDLLNRKLGAIRGRLVARNETSLMADLDESQQALAHIIESVHAVGLPDKPKRQAAARAVPVPPGCVDIGAHRFHAALESIEWLAQVIADLQQGRRGTNPLLGPVQRGMAIRRALAAMPADAPRKGFEPQHKRRSHTKGSSGMRFY
jgi:hypothetical protein